MPDTEKETSSLIDKYVALDIEYAGSEPGQGSIIMLAAVKVAGGRSIGKFKSLIAPKPDELDKAAQKTGVDSKTLMQAPDLETMLPAFLSFIGSDPIVGHDIGFVGSFIDGLYRGVLGEGHITRRIDTKPLAGELYPELKNCTLAELSDLLFGKAGAGRNYSGAELAARCYEYMKRQRRKTEAEPKLQMQQTKPAEPETAPSASELRPEDPCTEEPPKREDALHAEPEQKKKVRKQIDLERAFDEELPEKMSQKETGTDNGKAKQIVLKIALVVFAVAICFWLIMYLFRQKPFWLIGALVLIPFYVGVIIALGKKKNN